MTHIHTVLEVLILLAVLVVIYLIISNKEKSSTKITLIKKYKGDNLHFTKNFIGLIPKTDFVKMFDRPMETVDYYYNVEKKVITIVALDAIAPWSDQEYEQLHKEKWECVNIMHIQKKE